MTRIILLFASFCLFLTSTIFGQGKTKAPATPGARGSGGTAQAPLGGIPNFDVAAVPVSKADLGTFPYLRTLPNFAKTDSATITNNRTYFYDGKKFFTIDGKVSTQNLNVLNSDQPTPSIFECIQQFDKVILTLGGVKFFTGRMPDEGLKAFAGEDAVTLGSNFQVAPSSYYGVVEYVIRTPEKEVWIQLQPYSLASKFYTLLVVEKTTPMLSLNTNRPNMILAALEKDKKAVFPIAFLPDSDTLMSESTDDLLSLAGVYQAHPDWKLTITCFNAPVGKPEYALALTNKRALAIKRELLGLGVKDGSVAVVGMGDQKPVASNETERGRIMNNRLEITLQ